MENYIKEIENTVITSLDLKMECSRIQTEGCEGDTKKFEIVCDKNELDVKELNLIVETLQRCLKLPKASILLKDIIRNCIILVCRVPQQVEYYLLQLRITVCELKPLSVLKITTLIIDSKIKLNIPLDCDTKVHTHIYMYVYYVITVVFMA